jgi:thioredoxin reductase (NADPH)
LGLESESKFQGYGVSGCATCDGFFYKNKKVIVVGGGNTAVEEALYLTNHASEIILIHRRDKLRAEKILQDRLFNHPKIKIIWNAAIDEILGEEHPMKSVNAVRLRDTLNGELSVHQTDGVFIAIGHKPHTTLFSGQLEMDDEGYIITEHNSTKTSVPGIYAAGDVQDKIYRQAVTAAGSGCMAALEIERFLSGN